MKTLARTGAILSLGFCSVPGIALIAHAFEHGEKGAGIFGCLFLGLGCFAGTLLWLLPSLLARNPQPSNTTQNRETTPAQK